MHESETTNLIAQKTGIRSQEKVDLRGAEHADLRILIAQVRDLDDLGDTLEARIATRAEETLSAIHDMATVTVERGPTDEGQADAVRRPRTKVEIPAALLCRVQ